MAPVSLVLAVVLSCMAMSVKGFNITAILDAYPDFSLFNEWLTSTGVANEVNARATITVLATSNTGLSAYLSSVKAATDQLLIADTLRYQILLTYYGWPQLEQISVSNYTSVTTLLQTTGRANDTGFVDIYNTGKQILVGHRVPDSYGNQTVIGNVTLQPYAYSVLQISSVLIPLPSFLPAPLGAPTFAPAPSKPGLAPSVPIEGSPSTTKSNYASATRVTLLLTLTAWFVASIAVMF